MVNTVRSLAQKNFKPRVKKWQEGSFPFENIKDLAAIGVLGIAVPEE
jgi:alkylation response protein AidB-like acyl-CoA dehydrogenase